MRPLAAGLALLSLVGCGGQETCEADTCRAVCEAQVEAARALLPPDRVAITAYEEMRLHALLGERSPAVAPDVGVRFRLCAGEGVVCPPGTEVRPDQLLAVGAYTLVGPSTLAYAGERTLIVNVDCLGEPPLRLVSTVPHRPQASVDLEVTRLRLPLGGLHGGRCLILVEGEGKAPLGDPLVYRVPASPGE